MPTHKGEDSKGTFFQWGSKGKKYYYIPGNLRTMAFAKMKADSQGRAIERSIHHR